MNSSPAVCGVQYETLRDRGRHLPGNRHRELQRVARILFDEFDHAQKGKLSVKNKDGRILKLVLFGSEADACGCTDWAGDRKGGERPGYSLLVVVSTKTFTDPGFWWGAKDRLQRELTVTGHLAMPVNFIVHSIMDLNDQLARGRPFFVDIVRGGIMLYETPGYPLSEPKPLDPALAKAEALRRFDDWFPSATRRFELAKEASRRGYGREAAFDLHQTVERLYHCILHVLTLHSPKSHRLTFLRAHAERIAPRLIEAWPSGDRFARQCFTSLDRAYVEARYSHHYGISGEELAWLAERVAILWETVAAICEAHLDGFSRAGGKD
ncbi:HEPN domain-containing protein [Agrobacterium leguminum]|uniref:HEPN domain-containing protein n=1 Tax=Agrobacterium leguminum TaxID=2792015 RepID=UPI003CE5B61A